MSNPLLETALKYHDSGLAVVPIGNGTKAPTVSGWQKKRLTRPELEQYFGNGQNITGVGIITGSLSNNLVILDLDGKGWEAAYEYFFDAWHNEIFTCPTVETGSGKRHIYLRCPDLPEKFTNKKFSRGDAVIELRANKSNNLAPPSPAWQKSSGS